MKHKIVVIGCGNVGLSYIDKLTAQPNLQAEIVLIDLNEDKIEGEVLDLKQGLMFVSNHICLRVGDYADCADATIICITAGVAQSVGDRLDDLEKTNAIIHDIIKKVMRYHFDGIFLVASNPLDVMTYLVAYYADYPYQKVIGTGTMLDTARLQTLLSEKLEVKADNIMAYVLGEHGNSQFVAWNNANIGLQNINTLLTIEEKENIAQEVKNMGSKIVALKDHTNHGIAYCLVKLTMAILLDEHCVYPVSNFYEQYDVYISTPAVIGKEGIIRRVAMKLTEEEQEQFINSAQVIRTAIEKILPPELY